MGSNPVLGEDGNPDILRQQQASSHRGRWRLETPSKSEVPGENLKDTKAQEEARQRWGYMLLLMPAGGADVPGSC